MKRYWVYILASRPSGVLYIGVTSELIKRIHTHRTTNHGFTGKYAVKTLVYYEEHATAYQAISREKQLKNWKRAMKIDLIEKHNPDWSDLYPGLF